MAFTIDTTDLRNDRAPLFWQYDGQSQPQPAYIQIEHGGMVSAAYNAEIGDALPPSVYYGVDIRIPCPNCVDGNALADYLESEGFQKLLARLKIGHQLQFRHRETCVRGKLTDEAQEALNEIEQELQALKQWDVWTLNTYLDGSDIGVGDVKIAGSMDGLVAMWRKAIDSALGEGIHVDATDQELRGKLWERYSELIQAEAERGLYLERAQRAAEIIGYEIQSDED